MSSVMGSIFGFKGKPKIPLQQQEAPPLAVTETEAERSRKRQRKKLMVGGRKSTILSGIQSALKKRLGE